MIPGMTSMRPWMDASRGTALAAAFVVIALVAMVVVPTVVRRQAEDRRDRVAEQLEPFGRLTNSVHLNTLIAAGSSRAYGVTRNEPLLERYGLNREALLASLPPMQEAAVEAGYSAESDRLLEDVTRWVTVADGYVAAYRTGNTAGGDALLVAQGLPQLDAITADARSTEAAIDAEIAETRDEVRTLENVEQGILVGAAVVGAVAAAAVLWLAVQRERSLRDMRAVQDELAHNVARLTRANAAKDDFLGSVSHELKTPITVILGNAEILANRGDRLDEAAKRDALEDIYHDSIRLHQIIENLLALARLERGRDIEIEPVSIERVLASVMRRHASQYPARRVEAEVMTETPAIADPSYVEQVLVNLLNNAEKYSGPAEVVTVRVEQEADTIQVSVLDRGMGMSEEEAAHAFEAFYRAPSAAHVQGAGIGLAVCEQMVTLLGGRMWLRRREGGGMDAGFSLPADRDAEEDAVAERAAPGVQ